MNDDEYEDDVREWLAPLKGEAPPADREFLRGLRERSAAEFERAEAQGAGLQISPHPGPLPEGEGERGTPGRARWARRIVAAAAACLAGAALWFAGDSSSANSGPTLGEVLRRTVAAQSLHLEVRRNAGQAQVWVRDAGLVRWEDAPGQYAIARGSQLWRIDEATNTALRDRSPYSTEQGVDLVALLEAGGNFQLDGLDDWLATAPNARGEYLGADCLGYEREFDTEGGPIRVIAYADLEGRQLRGLVAWRRDAPGGPPLAELRLVAVNAPVDESKFVVAQSLTEDGRIGKVLDVQGLAALRPVLDASMRPRGFTVLQSPLAQRWTPICGPLPLRPGDWVRTETRGANAVRVALSSQVELTLGPGALLELISPTRVRVHSGEVQVKVASTAEGEFTLLGQGDAAETLAAGAEGMFRRRKTDDPLTRIDAKPPWLAGFEGSSSNESLGSLIATVDGRGVPLSVGYHKVTVDIRDQIARTVIEESFVNHTDARLEGVFYFPLPADASISGFGMWIGGELVEADVVEKQRAREIYETIVRERRDPGLLEWTSGNLFKARVFPIEANSEKRIKLVYTQVLPLRDNQYVYSYGLRSELLRTRPLRELAIDVRVSSELPLRGVSCPTHDVRAEQTEHAGHVEFAAQEYAPTRDFEIVFEIDGRQSDVVVIPHQRGEDGYFLVQLTPPSTAGNWRRDTLPDSEPLELVLLCDTSGSMDSESRRQQREFVAAVLSSLGPDDRFAFAACDVDVVWSGDSGEVASATGQRVEQALQFLDARRSLGWTNLDKAFSAVLGRANDNTQIIYIGDGVPSSGDADPQALSARLRRLYDDSPRGTFHAVAVGNLYEAVVLKAIAGLGGGSQRRIGGELTPQRVALELLREVTEPGLRDIAVEFDGVQVAAVYPERLPNLPAGAQQILVGRYLPQVDEQVGELIVTGRRGDETVRYATTVRFPKGATGVPPVSSGTDVATEQPASTGGTPVAHQPDGADEAGEGNSFIPRLWARLHLDHLLDQGASQTIQDEIIALSEEFHIITPYTSLLVLETDADRERFGVKRRFQMRDGERFFAEGRDNANYELTQQQMRAAAGWRQGLRMQILAGLATLGRDVQIIQQLGQAYPERLSLSALGDYGGPFSGRAGGRFESGAFGGAGGSGGGFGGGGGWGGGGFAEEYDGVWEHLSDRRRDRYARSDLMSISGAARETPPPFGAGRYLNDSESYFAGADETFGASDFIAGEGLEMPWQDEAKAMGKMYAGAEFMLEQQSSPASPAIGLRGMFGPATRMPYASGGVVAESAVAFGRYGYWSNPYAQWLAAVFPDLPAPPVFAKPPATADLRQDATWSAEAIEITESLLRVEALRDLEGGVEVRRTSESLDPRWDRVSGRSEQLELSSPSAWLTRPVGEGVHTVVQWCDAEDRGAFSRAFELGRTRPATDADRDEIPLGLGDDSLRGLHEVYRDWQVRVERPGDGRVVLTLTVESNPTTEMRLTIDTERHVLLERQQLTDGKVVATTTFADFVEVAGAWWAQSIETRDADGAVTSRVTQTIELLAADEFAARLAEELPTRAAARGLPTPSAPAAALLIRSPLPSLRRAKDAVADGSGGVEAHLVVLDDLVQRQMWDEAFERLESIEALAPEDGWRGVRWIRISLEQIAGRNAVALERIIAEAQRLTDDGGVADRLHLANHLIGIAASIAEANKRLALVDSLRPVFDDQPETVGAQQQWKQHRLSCLQNLGRFEDALALEREIAAAAPWDIWPQTNYARSLANAGEHEAAYAWLRQEIDRSPRRLPSDATSFVTTYADLLHEQGRYDDEADFLAERVELGPEDQTTYSYYLSALVFADRLEQAESLVEDWLTIGDDAAADAKLALPDLARLYAAVEYARGSRRNINVNLTEEKWRPPLAAVAERFATHPFHADVASQIINDWRFADSDESDALRRDLFERLQRDAETLKPALLSQLVGWAIVVPNEPRVSSPQSPEESWREILAVIRQRWSTAEAPQEKHELGQALATIYASRFGGDQYLPFLREQIDAAAPQYRAAYVSTLFEALVSGLWTDEHEAEAFKLLDQLSDAEDSVDRLVVQLPALYRLVDVMVNARVALARSDLQATGHPEELTRTEAAANEAEFLKAAREGVAARLADAAADAEEPLAKWLRLERLTLDVQLERDLGEVAATCWEILGEAPPAADEDLAEADGADPAGLAKRLQAALFDGVYRERVLSMAMYLAVRRDSAPERAAQLVKFLDAGIAQGGDNADAWRLLKYHALVALDRPQELERDLRGWIAAGGPAAPWRVSLGRLLAEQGRLAEAIQVFEAARAADELAPRDLMALARWYQAVDRRDDYEQATLDAFMTMDENSLSQILDARLQAWWNGDLDFPTELQPEVLLTFEALFRKSTSPDDYAQRLAHFYQACRDFRLLRMAPDAATGRTQLQVYPFLESLDSELLGEVRDEAVADEMLGRIAELRAGELTPLDARALDLLEAMIERRSSEVLNQPGPHVEAALGALERAFRGEWADGEAVQMARLLANLGRITAPELAELQVRQLRALHAQGAAGSLDRLRMAQWLAHALFWSFDQPDEALGVLDGAVREFERATEGRWPADATDPLDVYVNLLERRGRYAEAETLDMRLAATPATPDMANWFANRLNRVYLAALNGDGQVSLGRGEELYRNLVDHMLAQLDTADHEHRYDTFLRLLDVFTHGHDRPALAAEAARDLRNFAAQRLPELLRRQPPQYEHYISHTAAWLHGQINPRAGLEFLIEHMESYPPWLEMSWNNAWQQHGHRLAEWRQQIGDDLGELEGPLLRIVLAELRRDLRSRETRNRYLYHNNYGYFWEAKRGTFEEVAMEILAERRGSGRSVKYVADYLWEGLDLHDQAIEALLVAHRDGILDDGGQQQLVVYLHVDGRFGESIALLEPLIERLPNDLNSRRQLMLAFYKTDRLQERDRVRSAADEYFREAGRWNEVIAAAFADACREAGLHELATDYYQEAISLVQRQQPGGGVGGEELPRYYRGLAESYSALGKTAEAVDAASGAVVSWGPDNDQRDASINSLRQVLEQAADLDAYVRLLDGKAEESGQDSPLIRKVIAEIYFDRDRFADGERQMRLAIELEPNDLEAHRRLLEAIDAEVVGQRAIEQLLVMIDLDRRNLELYVDLAQRPDFDAMEAERAATSLVEASPQEAENHAALAELRQTQNRWAEAIGQWRHVARIRSLEPDGLLKIAAAQVHLDRWDDAEETVRQLLAESWPARFQELPAQIQQLQQQIAAGRD